MKQLDLIKIELLVNSIRKEKISDDEYFSPKYSEYASNSLLGFINPDQGGSPQKFFIQRPKLTTSSLELGSAVHQLWLEPELHELQVITKPSAKLGDVYTSYLENRNDGMSIEDSIILACIKHEYYLTRLKSSRSLVKEIVSKCFIFHLANKKAGDKIPIYLPKPMKTKCQGCLQSLNGNPEINDWIARGDKYPEEAFFCDFKVSIPVDFSNLSKGYDEIIVPFKLKADLLRIDQETNTFFLDDLKTSGKNIQTFMGSEVEENFQPVFKPGSWQIFHYARQMGLYYTIIDAYLQKTYGCKFKGEASMIVVETTPPHFSNIFHVSKKDISLGLHEGITLLKRIGYHKLRGIDSILEFEKTDILDF